MRTQLSLLFVIALFVLVSAVWIALAVIVHGLHFVAADSFCFYFDFKYQLYGCCC